MAKKKKKKNVQKTNPNIKKEVVTSQEVSQEEGVVLQEEKEEKVQQEPQTKQPQNKDAKKQKQQKKEKKQSKVGRKIKESFAELKNVTWPTFPKVVKQTGVVLGVVVFFTLVLFGFDYVLKFLFKLLNRVEYSSGELWGSVGIVAAIILIVVVWVIVWAARRKRGERK